MKTQTQLFVTLNPQTRRLVIEAPGLNGVRRKIETYPGLVEMAIFAELLEQEARIQANEAKEILKQKAEAAERHRRVWDTAASRKNQGQEFAQKIFGNRDKRGSPKAKKPELRTKTALSMTQLGF